jgi:hypothetical protein
MKTRVKQRAMGISGYAPTAGRRLPEQPSGGRPPAPSLDLDLRQARAQRLGHQIGNLRVSGSYHPAIPPVGAAGLAAPIQRVKTSAQQAEDEESERTPLLQARPDAVTVPRPVFPPSSGIRRFPVPQEAPPPVPRSARPPVPEAAPPQFRNAEAPRHQQILFDPSPVIGLEHHQAIASNLGQDASTAISAASGLGTGSSIASRAVEYLDTANQVRDLVPGLGVATGALSALGSTVDTGERLHQIATGTEQAGDKAQLGLEAASSAANATLSGATTAYHASTLLGATSGLATSVAAPAAVAMGGVDMIGGGIAAYRARNRQQQLQGIASSHTASDYERGVARFAAESQRTKKKRGLGTALKGGLAIGGGLALLLGAGPIGWGLLGGAAAVAGGMALYKRYRKHKEGKKILDNPEYQQQLTSEGHVRIPTPDDLAKQPRIKRWNPFNTKESRTHDLIRAQIAQHLETHVNDPDRNEVQADDAENNPLGAMVGILGLRNKGRKKAKARDIARALEG